MIWSAAPRRSGRPSWRTPCRLATSIASFVVQLVLVLMLSFYIMLDGQRIARGFLGVMPLTVREDAVFFLESVNRGVRGLPARPADPGADLLAGDGRSSCGWPASI